MVTIIKTNGEMELLEKEYVNPLEFNFRNDIQNVILEDVSVVGMGAFSNCSNLKEVVLKGVGSLELGAFGKCNNIKVIHCDCVSILPENLRYLCGNGETEHNFNIPESMNILTRELAIKLGFQEMETVEIPAQFDTIGVSAFEGFCKLKEVILHKNVRKISARAFYKCSQLETIKGIYNVRYLGDLAFSGSSLSGDINIDILDYLGSECFKDTNLNSFNVITVKFPIIPEGSFADTKLKSIKYSRCSLVKIIGDRAFENCKWLEQFDINLTCLEYIGNRSFYNTGDLNLVSDSSNLIYVGDRAFDVCSSMVLTKNIPPLIIGEDISLKGNVLCYDNRVTNYQNKEEDIKTNIFTRKDAEYYLNEFGPNLVIPSGFGIIDSKAFEGLDNIRSVDLNTVHTIHHSSFKDCKNLKVVKLGTSAQPTSIGKQAFYGCKSLEYVGNTCVGNRTIKSIGSNAFYNSFIKYLNFEEIQEVEDMAFNCMKHLDHLSVKLSPSILGDSCFDTQSEYWKYGYIYLDPIEIKSNSLVNSKFDTIILCCQQKAFKDLYFSYCRNLEQLVVADLKQFLLDKDNYEGCNELKSISIVNSDKCVDFRSLLRDYDMYKVHVYVNGEFRKR